MGERVQKIAFLVFALMFVAIMAILNTSILTLGTSANSQLTSTVSGTDSALAVYDQAIVYGSAVQNCAKNPSNVCSTDMRIFVVTNADATSGSKEYGSHEDADADEYVASAVGASVINGSAKFKSYLCYNDNNVCTGILFIQDNVDISAGIPAAWADGLTVQGATTTA